VNQIYKYYITQDSGWLGAMLLHSSVSGEEPLRAFKFFLCALNL
jgi:hypothetical protein